MKTPTSIFASRLYSARKRAQLTQEQLAVLAGIDEMSASARISQYESGKYAPKYEIAINLARVLKIPVEYLYAENDDSAELILLLGDLPEHKQKAILVQVRQMSTKED